MVVDLKDGEKKRDEDQVATLLLPLATEPNTHAGWFGIS